LQSVTLDVEAFQALEASLENRTNYDFGLWHGLNVPEVS
jgi:hypothetical protein